MLLRKADGSNYLYLNAKGIWLFVVFFLPAEISSAIAIFSPDDIGKLIDKETKVLIEVMSNFIPSMKGHISASKTPDVVGVFYFVSWVVFPIQCLVFMIGERYFARYDLIEQKYGHNLISRLKFAIYSLLFFLICFFGVFFIHRDPSILMGGGINGSRIGLALFGSLEFFALVMGFSISFVSIKNFIKGLL